MNLESENLSIAERFMTMNLAFAKENLNLQMTRTIYGYADGDWISEEWLRLSGSETLEKTNVTNCGRQIEVVSYSLTDELLAKLRKLASSARKDWEPLPPAFKAECLCRAAKIIQENPKLYDVLGCVSTLKASSTVSSKAIYNLVKSLFYNAGCVLEIEDSSWSPYDNMCLIADKYSCPLMSMCFRLISAIAAGNSVLVLAEPENCLPACLLADVFAKAGIPGSLVNVIIKDENFHFRESVSFDKLLFTGPKQNIIREAKIDAVIPRRPVVIIYENSDLHSAAEAVLESFFENHPKSEAGGCKVMVQSSVFGTFLNVLEKAFSKMDVGSRWSDSDLLFTEQEASNLLKLLDEASKTGKVFALPSFKKPSELHIHPEIVSGVETGFKLVHKELGGPIIVVISFRTEKESISMFNCDNAGSPVSVWAETVSVALEAADKLNTGTIWINSHHVLDASVPFSAICGSGNCAIGGKEEFYSHLNLEPVIGMARTQRKWTTEEKKLDPVVRGNKREYKFWINGEHKTCDNYLIYDDSLIYNGSASDVQNAASSASAAQLNWQAVPQTRKRLMLHSVAKKLEDGKEEFVREFITSGMTEKKCLQEIADSVKILHYFALQNHLTGDAQNISSSIKVIQQRCPVGVIGIDCPAEDPLLSLITLVAPAVMFGNSVVCVVRHDHPEPILKLGEIFSLSGFPKGVVNIVFGYELPDAAFFIDQFNAIWTNYGGIDETHWTWNPIVKFFFLPDLSIGLNEDLTSQITMNSTYKKSIFLPFGDIFAN